MTIGGISKPTRAWLDEAIAGAQRVADDLTTAERDESATILSAFAAALPHPSSALDRIVLRSLLLDVAFKSGKAIHARVYAGLDIPCPFSPTTLLDQFWSGSNDDGPTQFEQWRIAFFEELNRVHPPSLASSVGRLLKHDVQPAWRLGDIGQRFHASPSRVQRTVQAAFGMSPAEFHRLARVAASLAPLRRDKIDTVARSVGFKSAKNFYRAFARLVGMTPRAFKDLSQEDAGDIQTKLRRRLLRGR